MKKTAKKRNKSSREEDLGTRAYKIMSFLESKDRPVPWFFDSGAERAESCITVMKAIKSRQPLRVFEKDWGPGCFGRWRASRAAALKDWREALAYVPERKA